MNDSSSPTIQIALHACDESDTRMSICTPEQRAELEQRARAIITTARQTGKTQMVADSFEARINAAVASETDSSASATYIGAYDLRGEDALPPEMRRELHMFNLLKPLGQYPFDATVTLEALRDELGVALQEPLNGWKKGDIV